MNHHARFPCSLLLLGLALGLVVLAPGLRAQYGSDWEEHRDLEGEFLEGVIRRFDGWSYRAPSEAPASQPGQGSGPGADRVYQPPARIAQQHQLPSDRTPWSGVWWPRGACELAFMGVSQNLSPLEKYDTFVASRTGRVARAALWEADPWFGHNTAGGGHDWAGHCNGVAAASILVPEPPARLRVALGDYPVAFALVYSQANQVPPGAYRHGDRAYRPVPLQGGVLEFTGDDLEGLLAEQYMTCATMRFANPAVLGSRYNRQTIDYQDPSFQDIHPQYFHYLLQEFLKNRNQPFVIEIDPHLPVNNHPAYAYQAEGTRQGNVISFRTRVWMADYAPSWGFRGTKPMVRDYTYNLYLDQGGRIAGGEWTGSSVGTHPDFCWIPTGDYYPYQNRQNPHVEPRWIQEILSQSRTE